MHVAILKHLIADQGPADDTTQGGSKASAGIHVHAMAPPIISRRTDYMLE